MNVDFKLGMLIVSISVAILVGAGFKLKPYVYPSCEEAYQRWDEIQRSNSRIKAPKFTIIPNRCR